MDREGVLTICTLQNTATAGRKPVEKLVILTTAYYRKRTVGYNRLYSAMSANQSIDMLVRCYNTEAPEYSDLYVYFNEGEDIKQFRVAAMQEIVEEGAVDFTLERVETYYDIAEPT